jgi:dihydropteroate synthase
MGILNLTPDSFSDGGQFLNADHAVEHALQLVDEGADLLDVGGESSRPGAAAVSLEEERRRVLPTLERLLGRTNVPVSIDTVKPALAREALAMGVAVVNDIGGLRDPEMLAVVSACQAGVVLMHMAGTPQNMQLDPQYDDVVREVREALASRIDAAIAAGIERRRIAIDPGIGFGKRSVHNRALLRNLEQFQTLGCAVLIGTSRKSFLGAITNRPVGDRTTSSVVSSLAAIERGAQVVRVHDVGPMVDGIRVWNELMH